MTRDLNSQLQRDVLEELEWDPSLDSSKIGVSVDGGVVTLTGHVHSYTEKAAAERIVKRVKGVEAIANDIDVKLAIDAERDDADIARAAADALRWNVAVPKDRITVTVSDGWIALDGAVEWEYQRREAVNAVRAIRGMRGITNRIEVLPKVKAGDVKEKIEAALRRSAEVDAKRISVEASDGQVVLRGVVRSWVEHEDAVNAAWAAPGVRKVIDQLQIRAA